MIVGAMLDAGAGFDELRAALASLPLDGYRLAARRKLVSGISALKFDVEVSATQPERHLKDIREIVRHASTLSSIVKDRAMAIFGVLAEAEAKIHHTTPEEVHFHEVGAVDSIIDIVAAAWGFERLELGEMIVSPLPAGSGFVRSQHGIIPVPAPATAELLAGFPMRMGDGSSEMVTPTGAAILRALATPAPPAMGFRVERVGYGAGTRDFADRPNVLRLMVGERTQTYETDELVEIAANIDDLSRQSDARAFGRLDARLMHRLLQGRRRHGVSRRLDFALTAPHGPYPSLRFRQPTIHQQITPAKSRPIGKIERK